MIREYHNHPTEQHMTPLERATQHLKYQYIQKTVRAKQPAFSSTSICLQKLKGHNVMHRKTKTNTEPQ